MLKVNNIEVTYHGVILVLRGVSLEVGDGKIVSLLGANGAGKSTTLKAISGLLKTEVGRVSRGSIHFDGQEIQRSDPEELAKLGIIQVMEGRRILEHLTVEDELLAAGYIVRNRLNLSKELERIYHFFPKLKDLRHHTSGYCSGGEQQMLVIGRALMSHPKLVMLDEPSLGLAPILVEEIFRIVKAINEEEKVSILIVEQNAVAALDLAEYGYVMENGRIVLDGTSGQLKTNEDVKEFYLGFGALSQRKSYRDVKHYKRRKRWLG
ncbi:MAG: ABC transporter ATP-binding protein [Thermodesulfobacteriota bacterium]|jgi:branched-chain amino acid transport system ATP-binding protein